MLARSVAGFTLDTGNVLPTGTMALKTTRILRLGLIQGFDSLGVSGVLPGQKSLFMALTTSFGPHHVARVPYFRT
jgi:hypothetical protein